MIGAKKGGRYMKKAYFYLTIGMVFLLYVESYSAQFEQRIPPYLIHHGLEDNKLFKIGYLDVTLYGADPTGRSDSTKAIQKAIDDAREYHLVVFFPHKVQSNGNFIGRGEYMISSTMDCRMWSWDVGGYGRKSNILVGSKKGGIRPLVRLKSGSAGFQNTQDPQPMFWFWSTVGGFMKNSDLDKDGIYGKCRKEDKGAYYYSGDYYCDQDDIRIYDAQKNSNNPLDNDTDISFDQVFRGIDLDLGKNPGAIGLKNAGAQGQSIEDTTIDATYAYAGIGNIGGLGTAEYNIKIIGGKYGIYINTLKDIGKYHPPAAVVGIDFIDQEEAVIHIVGRLASPLAVVGFNIHNSGNIPVCVGNVYPGSGGIIMVDGVIKTRASFLFDVENMGLYLRNVYVQGAKSVTSALNIEDPGTWAQVKEYSLPSRGFDSMIDGKKFSGDYQDKIENVNVIEDQLVASLRDFHSYGLDDFPCFEDTDAVNVKKMGAAGDGVTDDTAAIQNAINTHEKIFLPKGHYRISATVKLKADTKFFGVSKKNTIISPMGSWKPLTVKTMLTTEDSKNGTAVLADLLIGNHYSDHKNNDLLDTYYDKKTQTTEYDQFRFTIIDWKVGKNSILRDVNAGSVGGWIGGNLGIMKNQGHRFMVTGNGGGHWYGARAGLKGQERNIPNLVIKNSDAPMYIYPINLHGESYQVNIDIVNSKNKFLYYPQQEGGATHIRITDSENIAVYGGHKNRIEDEGPDRGIFEVINSKNVVIAVSNSKESQMGGENHLYEVYQGNTYKIIGADIALFKRGELVRDPGIK